DLSGADLRPGQSLNKAPGQKLGLSAKGTRASSGTPADPQQRIDLGSLALQVLEDRIDARGWLESKGAGSAATQRFDLQGTRDRSGKGRGDELAEEGPRGKVRRERRSRRHQPRLVRSDQVAHRHR